MKFTWKDLIAYHIGRFSKKYRLKYYERNDNKWLWSVRKFAEDFPATITTEDGKVLKKEVT